MDMVELSEFEKWKLALKFAYDDEPKSWITEDNFNNTFTDSWDTLIEKLAIPLFSYCDELEIFTMKLNDCLLELNKKSVFEECIRLIQEIKKHEYQR
jgi:hypothetical protein